MDDFLTPRTSAALFASSTQQIEDIRTAAGFPKAQFDAVFLPLLHAYALNVQDLPLSPNAYHKPGGAWTFGLFVSILTLRVSASRMFFPTADSKQRRTLEPQCRFAAFAAGLASGVAILTQNVRLSDNGDEYYPLTARDSLATWLERAREPKFNWRTEDDPLTSQECAAIAARYLPARIMQPFDTRIVRMVYGAIYPQSAPNALETTLARVIRESIDAACKFYVDKFNQTYDPSLKAAPSISGREASRVAEDLASDGVVRELDNPLESADPATAPPEDQEGQVASEPQGGVATPGPAPVAPSTPAPSPAPTTPAAAPRPAPVPSAPPARSSAPVPASASASPSFMAKHGLVHKPLGTAPEPEAEPEVTHLTLLAAAAPELKDWFKVLRSHDAYDRLRDKLKVTEDGIEVPASLIGHLGLNTTTVLRLMDEAGMINRRSKDMMSVFLHSALAPLFFGTE